MKALHLRPARFEDSRGWFSESWNKRRLSAQGIEVDFVQGNHSLSRRAGTIRALHFQRPPHSQAKLVSCLKGRIFDVAVDIRTDSPSFRKWIGVELSAERGDQLFIPEGYAHGFLTLEDDCEVTYLASCDYAPESEGGIFWNDPELAINWPLEGFQPILSERDANLPPLSKASFGFAYDGDPLLPLDASF